MDKAGATVEGQIHNSEMKNAATQSIEKALVPRSLGRSVGEAGIWMANTA
jgi:hypothetical protein